VTFVIVSVGTLVLQQAPPTHCLRSANYLRKMAKQPGTYLVPHTYCTVPPNCWRRHVSLCIDIMAQVLWWRCAGRDCALAAYSTAAASGEVDVESELARLRRAVDMTERRWLKACLGLGTLKNMGWRENGECVTTCAVTDS
jgi:hypothetical protein